MKYKINNQEIETLDEMAGWYEPDNKIITKKINKLIQVLGTPVAVPNNKEVIEAFDRLIEKLGGRENIKRLLE